ncbi:MAG: response regulator [Fidelibacterota bacterium]|nr:MAG: response regulator [Candidatus Neomarinimicrobiota bacterium]
MALILIVDDSSFQRRVIRRLVHQAGHETEEAENGRTGLERAATWKPDIILTDLLMPELGGLELLEALREQGFAIPVIIITANIQESVRRRCLELGAAAVVSKPICEDDLLTAMEEALGDEK